MGNRCSIEWMCTADVGRAMSRTLILQTQGTGKAFPRSGLEERQGLLLVLMSVQMLTVCAESITHCFLLWGHCSLKLLSYKDQLI